MPSVSVGHSAEHTTLRGQVIRIIALDLHKSFNECIAPDAGKAKGANRVHINAAQAGGAAAGAIDPRRRLVKQSSMGSFLHKSSGFFGKAADAARSSSGPKRMLSSEKYALPAQ